ncbi:hypothetical protein SASPL_147980 [Salvia splendens]|uniref:F-box and leucine-rich repeat protein 2/20 n=1 Tax=Salvia splendens TaxID=180675 RepID=A0A8X8W8G9_SALSN|nr:hypothetical protein SASPL_147980 [Salvia splendens]
MLDGLIPDIPENVKLLKKLSLHCVNVSDMAVAFLLGNCSLVEQLSLSRCGYMLSCLEVVGTSPAFKCLEISHCIKCCLHQVRWSEYTTVSFQARRCSSPYSALDSWGAVIILRTSEAL